MTIDHFDSSFSKEISFDDFQENNINESKYINNINKFNKIDILHKYQIYKNQFEGLSPNLNQITAKALK